eukprot:2670893-Alexandrium_andersonii.AAC.1
MKQSELSEPRAGLPYHHHPLPPPQPQPRLQVASGGHASRLALGSPLGDGGSLRSERGGLRPGPLGHTATQCHTATHSLNVQRFPVCVVSCKLPDMVSGLLVQVVG